MAISEERIKARIFVLRHAAAWIGDIGTTDLGLDTGYEDHESVILEEAESLEKRLMKQAHALEKKLKG
jgi:hypothetical protein